MTGAQRCAPTFPMIPAYPYRFSTRMPSFDYGQSCGYFVTLVTVDRQPLFGRIVGGAVELSDAGKIVREEWLRTPSVRPGINLDEWTVMPDHFHAILFVDMEIHRGNGPVGAHHRSYASMDDDHRQNDRHSADRADGRCAPVNPLNRPPRTLGSLIAQFKATTTRRINEIRGTPGQKVWQRGYYDRIIRNEMELHKLRKYIRNNPLDP
jgi:putative transposase